jgi:TRAP-type C4-dicarboxylate transport system permease small subunit
MEGVFQVKSFLKSLDKMDFWITGVLLGILAILCLIQILFRFILNYSLAWTEALSRYLLIAMTFLGTASAAYRGSHTRVELIDLVMSKTLRKCYDTLVELVLLLFCIVLAVAGFKIANTQFVRNQMSPTLFVCMGWFYLIPPVGFSLMTFRLVLRICLRYFSK